MPTEAPDVTPSQPPAPPTKSSSDPTYADRVTQALAQLPKRDSGFVYMRARREPSGAEDLRIIGAGAVRILRWLVMLGLGVGFLALVAAKVHDVNKLVEIFKLVLPVLRIA
jgi:hypothetical protein